MNEAKERQEQAKAFGERSERAEQQAAHEKQSAPGETAKLAATCECPPGCVGLSCCT